MLEGPPCVFAILHSVDVGKRLLTGYLHRKTFEKSASRLSTHLGPAHRVHSLELLRPIANVVCLLRACWLAQHMLVIGVSMWPIMPIQVARQSHG